jgi:hypothetical protein
VDWTSFGSGRQRFVILLLCDFVSMPVGWVVSVSDYMLTKVFPLHKGLVWHPSLWQWAQDSRCFLALSMAER